MHSEASAEYVACMEDVLDVYELPYDPLYPQVCYDEWRRALISETRDEFASATGQAKESGLRVSAPWRGLPAYGLQTTASQTSNSCYSAEHDAGFCSLNEVVG